MFDYKGVGHIEFTVTLPENDKAPSFIACTLKFFLQALYAMVNYHYRKTCPPDNEMLFVTQSINNQRTLLPITQYLHNDNWSIISIYDFPISLIYWYSFTKFCDFVKFYSHCEVKEKYRVRRVFSDFVRAPGYFKVYKNYLTNTKKLRTIIVANDHTIPTRCLIEAAREEGVSVVYTQHASVTEKFPPLHFSYSFLDGMESYEKYKMIGDITGKVVLLGSPRFDEVISKKREMIRSNCDTVGIGLNPADSLEQVLNLCKYIKEKTNKRVIIRPHPRSMSSFGISFFVQQGVELSDSSKETSYDFFRKISVLVANESGIHLDAAIFGVPSIVFNFSDNPIRDWYGYIIKGLTVLARSENEVVDFIESPNHVDDDIIRYYYAAYHTNFDGKIAKTIASFLDASSNGSNALDYLYSNFTETNSGVFVI